MADAPKKPDAKPAPKKDPFVEIVSFVAGFLILLYALNGFISMFTSSDGVFSRGWQGLTTQGIILHHTQPISSLENPIGASVVSTSDTAVYDSPGGNQVGMQKVGARGKIIQGVVEINGVRYWYVDYDEGADGWVAEADIAYLQSEPTVFERLLLWIYSIFWVVKSVSVIISIAIIVLLVFIVKNLISIRTNQRALIYPTLVAADASPVNKKWERIQTHIGSLNSNDWRLAVIEADIMLSELLDTMHLPGETMGDKMKAVEESDFATIGNAWEAHKIRNRIAHEGEDFVLTQHEARRVVALYQTIFEEFKMI